MISCNQQMTFVRIIYIFIIFPSIKLSFFNNSTPWLISTFLRQSRPFVTNLTLFTETHHRQVVSWPPGGFFVNSVWRQFQIFEFLAPKTIGILILFKKWSLRRQIVSGPLVASSWTQFWAPISNFQISGAKNRWNFNFLFEKWNLPGWRLQRRTCRCLPVWRHIRGPGSRVAARTRVPWWRPWRTSLAALWRTVCRWRCGWSWRGRPCPLSGSRWSRCSRTSVRRWSHAGSPGTAPSWANAMNERGSRRDFRLCHRFIYKLIYILNLFKLSGALFLKSCFFVKFTI